MIPLAPAKAFYILKHKGKKKWWKTNQTAECFPPLESIQELIQRELPELGWILMEAPILTSTWVPGTENQISKIYLDDTNQIKIQLNTLMI